ncbi:SDR family NAD(P)-dependent oxidoreductase [Martelella lutilitoris]|uniref:SDR family NAD(P)-dependent oxidoreductase n=1 Tax=Martelella lutilitoris TaxID=2583532 RepID=A0A5C4JT31_9HYPH|nr:SDR family NAD(P)-dependent oxidoreductase [Martelella lutilitoris]TNB48477.1 SDR family NAD(P)-dependent oxidoreductase [Martelella lutilitoris]
MQLDGKKVLITGGSQGIGLALAMQCAEAGSHVVICARDRQRLEDIAGSSPGQIDIIQADLSLPGDVQRLVAEIGTHHADLSVLVNNAGVQHYADFFTDQPDREPNAIAHEMTVNFNAAAQLCLALIPILRRQEESAIVNVSSGLGLAPKKSAPVYCASKAAIRSFTKALRYQAEDAGSNMLVTDVIMALVETKMTQGRGAGKISPEQAAAAIIQGINTERREIWVGKTRLLRAIQRVSPSAAERLMRNG